jgi:hypothetical protein
VLFDEADYLTLLDEFKDNHIIDNIILPFPNLLEAPSKPINKRFHQFQLLNLLLLTFLFILLLLLLFLFKPESFKLHPYARELFNNGLFDV